MRQLHSPLPSWRGVTTALLAFLSLAGGAHAAPRVGAHLNFTRLVFDLPSSAKVNTKLDGQQLTMTLNVKLPAEHGKLGNADALSYRVKAQGKGTSLQLTLAPGRTAKAFVLEGPPRLVIDVQARQISKGTTVVRAVTRAAQPAKLRVVLDPGHGGKDPGMVGYVVEKEVNLDIALKLRKLLRARGVDVIMTRETDKHLSADKVTDLNARAKLANAGSVNAFVSIHVNAASPSARGIETYYFGQSLEPRNRAIAIRENGGGDLGEQLTRKSSNAAQNLLGDLLATSNLTHSRKLASLVQARLVSNSKAVNRGVDTAAFYVIRHARTPAILVEVGFGTHAQEGRLLASDAYRETLARAIADGLLKFLNANGG